jgi:hypothetical protein
MLTGCVATTRLPEPFIYKSAEQPVEEVANTPELALPKKVETRPPAQHVNRDIEWGGVCIGCSDIVRAMSKGGRSTERRSER